MNPSGNGRRSSPRARIDPTELPRDKEELSRLLLGDDTSGLDQEVMHAILSKVDHYDETSAGQAQEEFERFRGLEEVKEELEDIMFSLFVKQNQNFDSVLMHGPPGTGKTEIAFLLAKKSKAVFLRMNGASFASQYQGMQEKLVQGLFSLAKICRCRLVIFIDECDGLLGKKKETNCEVNNEMKNTFLTGMSALKNRTQSPVLFIGATNHPSFLMDEVIRRFLSKLYLPIPQSLNARVAILRDRLEGRVYSVSEPEFESLGLRMEGWSAAD